MIVFQSTSETPPLTTFLSLELGEPRSSRPPDNRELGGYHTCYLCAYRSITKKGTVNASVSRTLLLFTVMGSKFMERLGLSIYFQSLQAMLKRLLASGHYDKNMLGPPSKFMMSKKPRFKAGATVMLGRSLMMRATSTKFKPKATATT